MENINECTIVAGNLNDKNYLFKNRDKMYMSEYKIVHELFEGVEIVITSDSTGWAEGMNEYGIGFVYSFLAKPSDLKKNIPNIMQSYSETSDSKTYKEKINDFKKILSFKKLDDAVKWCEKKKWNGNYFIADKNNVYELEIYGNQIFKKFIKKDELMSRKYVVKTNISDNIIAGHQNQSNRNENYVSAYFRKYNTEQKLIGVKNYFDILKRMSHNIFEPESVLNQFRRDESELTISQFLMELEDKIFIYLNMEDSRLYQGIQNVLPKSYTPKIKLIVYDISDFNDNQMEWKRFKTMSKNLYQYWKDISIE